jgi:hypothetical protein
MLKLAEGEHGEKKINFWEGPTRVSEWKEEQVRRTEDCPSDTLKYSITHMNMNN